MPYFTDLHTYLHQSSLLIQAYPSTRITTKYSLPRKANSKSRSNPSKEQPPASAPSGETTSAAAQTQAQVKRDPSAILTLKTFHPESGICLKYRTDKAAEVGRLLAGLGRLAKGEVIEMPTAANGQPATTTLDGADKMDVDSGNGAGVVVPKAGDNVVAAPPAASQTGGGGGGGKGKKKKGKK
ncbi:hypothetical protein LTR99_004686 [Exophiala xenobiotica]|uniref:SRP9 domain-containing protein n=1 Tax=Vermiconidia calcicola TaxID=1690605 RepID=A0AAV9QEI1_9PEZI|nr:hypothetical protein LTR72_004394 [Exophiala xenobiotica]KAK5539967.1 hypothetical protein LTR25_003672 [Vermiconidia calcicola]KAK5546915.1 hypothetical protein LTR23_002918 [Chaetothyriales sp. CCFEE 6169]KAK5274607.1 hypothetical protein LTR96_001208 [Exophiala xenobiotica]KAK5293696.1 hypothetical protein LTR14_004587 [Exophiala xenobiotica]